MDALDRIAAIYCAIYVESVRVDLRISANSGTDGSPAGYTVMVQGVGEHAGEAGPDLYCDGVHATPSVAVATLLRALETRLVEHAARINALAIRGA